MKIRLDSENVVVAWGTDLPSPYLEVEPPDGFPGDHEWKLVNGELVAIDFRTLDQARKEAVARIEAQYKNALAQGHTVIGKVWAISDVDRAALGEGLNILNSALLIGAVTPDTLFENVTGRNPSDIDGNSVPNLTVGQYIGVCLALGQRVGALQAARNKAISLIAASQTNSEIDSINMELI